MLLPHTPKPESQPTPAPGRLPSLTTSGSTTSDSTLSSNVLPTKPTAPVHVATYNDKSAQAKPKKKNFFSNIVRRKQDDEDDKDQGKDRDEGWNANVFGYLANFPTPPKYIWVRAHRKKQREFNHLFLAQELKAQSNTDPGAGKPTTWCARFSLDGKYLATAGADRIIRVWQVISTPEERGLYNEMSAEDEESSIRTTRRGSIRRGGKASRVSAPVFLSFPIREYSGHTQDILDLTWSKNNFLLSSSMDKTVRLWHLKMPSSIVSFMHSDFVTSVAFHPKDDRFFLSGSLDCKLRLWSIPEKKVAYISRAPDLIMTVAFTPDGNTSIAGCFGGQCLFYDTDGLTLTNQMIVKSSHGKNSNGSKITGIEVIDMPDNYRRGPQKPALNYKLLISTNDSRIRLYNFEDRTMVAKFKGHENSQALIRATFSDTGAYAISGSEDDRTYIWRIRPEANDVSKTHENYEYFHSNNSIVTVAIFAPHATRRLVYESRDPIYDIADPPPVILNRPHTFEGTQSGSSSIHSTSSNATNSAAAPTSNYKVNPYDGNIIITADRDGNIKVFRQDSAYERRRLHQETASNIQKKKISGVTLSPTVSIPASRSNSVIPTLSMRSASPRGKGRSSRQSDTDLSPRRADTVQGKQYKNNMGETPLLQPDARSLSYPPVRSGSPSSISSLESSRSNTRRLNAMRLTPSGPNSSAPGAARASATSLSASTVVPSPAAALVPGRVLTDPGHGVDTQNRSAGTESETEIKCRACNGTDFRARTTSNGTFALVCTNCRTIQTS